MKMFDDLIYHLSGCHQGRATELKRWLAVVTKWARSGRTLTEFRAAAIAAGYFRPVVLAGGAGTGKTTLCNIMRMALTDEHAIHHQTLDTGAPLRLLAMFDGCLDPIPPCFQGELPVLITTNTQPDLGPNFIVLSQDRPLAEPLARALAEFNAFNRRDVIELVPGSRMAELVRMLDLVDTSSYGTHRGSLGCP